MTSQTERRLEAAAEATDAVVTRWDARDENVLRPTFTDPGSSRRHRTVYPLLSAAAVAAVVVTAVAIGRGGSEHKTASGGSPSAPVRTPISASVLPSPPTQSGTPADAARALKQNIPGLRSVRYSWTTSGSFTVDGQYWPGGKHLANVFVQVAKAGGDDGTNPCILQPGEQAGHQGAPAPDDKCSSAVPGDGTKVWIQKEGHSPSRSWTTADTKVWNLSQVRKDGAFVSLQVTNLLGEGATPTYPTIPWHIDEGTLINTVTSPGIDLGGRCTQKCGRVPQPPKSSETPRAPKSSETPKPGNH